MTNKSEPIPFIHNPHSPDVFADAATGFFFFAGNLRITFESVRVDHTTSPGPLARVVVGRIVIPIAQAEGMARGILDFLEKQRTQPTPEAQGTPTLQ